MSDLVPSDVVKAIQDSTATQVVPVGGVEFTDRQVFAPPIEQRATTLEIHTLTGLVDYLAANIDSISPATNAIHIVSPEKVTLVSVLDGRPKRRDVLVSAAANDCEFNFGLFQSCEQFVIALQSLFADVEDRASVLKIVGNIKEEAVGAYDDDGVTQTVTAKAGIARVGEVPVPNPVVLAPFRTFAEIEQPTSPFILRMKAGMSQGSTPTCALFEADGGKWKLAAIEGIAKYLRIKIAELKKPMNEIAIIA